jgi:hypothetical protein
MPRYFFNLYNDLTALDEEGKDFPDLATAMDHGIMETRTMICESVGNGHIDLNHRIEIADESGAVVETIRFGDAVLIKGSPTPPASETAAG